MLGRFRHLEWKMIAQTALICSIWSLCMFGSFKAPSRSLAAVDEGFRIDGIDKAFVIDRRHLAIYSSDGHRIVSSDILTDGAPIGIVADVPADQSLWIEGKVMGTCATCPRTPGNVIVTASATLHVHGVHDLSDGAQPRPADEPPVSVR